MTERNVGAHGRHARRARRGRGFAPACEAIEPREMLSGFTPVPVTITGGLAPGIETGIVPGLQVTDFRQPTFAGTTLAGMKPVGYAIVQLFAQRFGDGGPKPLGQTVSDPTGGWSLTVGPLVDGIYRVTASVTAPGTDATTDPGSFPTPPRDLTPTGQGPPQLVVVDTVGPRVAGLSFDPAAGQISVTFQDAGLGLDPVSLNNPANYVLVRANDPRGARPITLVAQPGVSGFYTGALTEVLTVVGGPLVPGAYTFEVASAGVVDRAGNALDGEFLGTFPSGDGHPGGNFLATLTVPRAPRGPRARARLH
jgi:hypothetical protein